MVTKAPHLESRSCMSTRRFARSQICMICDAYILVVFWPALGENGPVILASSLCLRVQECNRNGLRAPSIIQYLGMLPAGYTSSRTSTSQYLCGQNLELEWSGRVLGLWCLLRLHWELMALSVTTVGLFIVVDLEMAGRCPRKQEL